MNACEHLGLWYLRLNGYFTMPNFVVHGSRGSARTDVDVLGVRFPYSREYPDDVELPLASGKMDIVLAESKESRCRLNSSWRSDGNDENLAYIIKRVGAFETDTSCSIVAKELCEKQRFENATCVVRILCFGSEKNDELGQAIQVLWPDIIGFIRKRFRKFRRTKADHQHWDSFGIYLYETLTADRSAPELEEIIAGWEAIALRDS